MSKSAGRGRHPCVAIRGSKNSRSQKDFAHATEVLLFNVAGYSDRDRQRGAVWKWVVVVEAVAG